MRIEEGITGPRCWRETKARSNTSIVRCLLGNFANTLHDDTVELPAHLKHGALHPLVTAIDDLHKVATKYLPLFNAVPRRSKLQAPALLRRLACCMSWPTVAEQSLVAPRGPFLPPLHGTLRTSVVIRDCGCICAGLWCSSRGRTRVSSGWRGVPTTLAALFRSWWLVMLCRTTQ